MSEIQKRVYSGQNARSREKSAFRPCAALAQDAIRLSFARAAHIHSGESRICCSISLLTALVLLTLEAPLEVHAPSLRLLSSSSSSSATRYTRLAGTDSLARL